MADNADPLKRQQVQDSFKSYSGLDNLKSLLGMSPMAKAIDNRRKSNNTPQTADDPEVASE